MGKPVANQHPVRTDSMARQFARDYLAIALIPLLVLSVIVSAGMIITRSYLAGLIVQATGDLNMDAERSLQALGETFLQSKARDVAGQIEIYFRMHPDMTIQTMRNDPLFMRLAIQSVGRTGYTVITEAHNYRFRVHPNAALNDQDMRPLADKLPSWWKIIEIANQGVAAAGYYDWLEADGTIRKKYMALHPIAVPLQGTTQMVAATTYIDEFSTPIVNMQKRADNIVSHYQRYVSRQWTIFGAIAALTVLLTFAATYFIARRAARRYILPITRLAEHARMLGEGEWNGSPQDAVLQRKDEIGTLATALHSMSRQLQDLFDHLDQRVQELKRTQAALETSEAHYRALYETSQRAEELYRSLIHSSADAIVIYDLAGHASYISPMFTTIFEWTAEELLGQRIPFVPESEAEVTRSRVLDVVEKGVPCHGFETRRTTKSGRVIDVSISASRYDDHEGHPAGMLVILRDISERKRFEAQLQHVERMEAIGTLAGGVAHDFNNLLMVILGNATLLKQGTAADDARFKLLCRIEEQVERGSKLTRQLLGYARKGRYEVKMIDLNEVVRENTETLKRTRKDIAIHYDLAPDLSGVAADVTQIQQVLMNLFINASDAMPDGGDLYLKTRNISAEALADRPFQAAPGTYVRLTVTDTGIGMDRKTMDRIFDPFFTTKEMGRGTGLGLASVYGIVKSHEGYIDVESQVDRGTTFGIYLPAAQTAAVVETRSASPPVSRGRGTILLIDDESSVMEVGEKMLRTLGYQVITADSGHDGIDRYRNRRETIDMVILDMIMPDMSGSATFDALKAIDPAVRIVLSSGYSMDGRAAAIMARGCVGFIQKPYSMAELAKNVAAILDAGG